jgi:3-hydroxyisobutyrate dehydrogenase-like beta-hydroxyacid dehydrogenase
MKTAFIGLGVMGFPMAGHLKAAGHEVTVFNRSPDKAARWVEKHGGASGPTIAEAVAGASWSACAWAMTTTCATSWRRRCRPWARAG